MSDEEHFLRRWSRRKRTAAPDARERLKPEKDSGAVASEDSDNYPSSEHIKSPFHRESLPPIESIGPGSEVRAFLAAGVPADLTRAALRRLWASDPKIRDFIGLSESSWDFNAPGSMAGFGPIDKEEVGRVLTQLLGDSNIEATPSDSTTMRRQAREREIGSSESDPTEAVDPTAAVDQRMLHTAGTINDVTQRIGVAPVSQQVSASAQHRASPRKGSALPE